MIDVTAVWLHALFDLADVRRADEPEELAVIDDREGMLTSAPRSDLAPDRDDSWVC